MSLLDVLAQPPPVPPAHGTGLIPELPHAWSLPYLWFFDTYRLVLVACNLYILYLMSFATFLAPTMMQRAFTTSYACSTLVGMWSQVERLGAPPSWRLIPITIGSFLGVWGAFKFIMTGTPKEHRRWWWMFKPPVVGPPRFPSATGTDMS